MKCEEVRELIPLCVGHEIGHDEEDVVQQHIVSCPECAHEMKEYRLIASTLSQLREEEAPDGVWDEMWYNIRKRLFGSRARMVFSWEASLRFAAAVLIGVAIGFLSISLLTKEKPSPAPDSVAGVKNVDNDNPEAIIPVYVKSDSVDPSKKKGMSMTKRVKIVSGGAEERYYLPSADTILPATEEVKF